MDSLCNCSDVWLQDSRLEQHVEQPSLFIKEEIMLQPQPHIDLLRRVYSLRNQDRYCPIHTQIWPAASFCSLLAVADAAEQTRSPRFSRKNISQAEQQVAPRLGKNACALPSLQSVLLRGEGQLPKRRGVHAERAASPSRLLTAPPVALVTSGLPQPPRQHSLQPGPTPAAGGPTPSAPHACIPTASRQHPQQRAAARTRSCRPGAAPPPDKDLPATRGSSENLAGCCSRTDFWQGLGKKGKKEKRKGSLPEDSKCMRKMLLGSIRA